MTKVEKEICGKLVDEAIMNAEKGNAEFEEYGYTEDTIKRGVLIESGHRHLGYAEGINQVLANLHFKDDRMKELSKLL